MIEQRRKIYVFRNYGTSLIVTRLCHAWSNPHTRVYLDSTRMYTHTQYHMHTCVCMVTVAIVDY